MVRESDVSSNHGLLTVQFPSGTEITKKNFSKKEPLSIAEEV